MAKKGDVMRIFLPPLEISDSEGFTSEKDIFGRRNLGQGMIDLLGRVSDPLVLALDAQWGSGKTTFLKMWAGELRKARFPVVYLDAFSHDYEDDAFTALAGEIVSLAESLRKADAPAAQLFKDKAIGAGKVILRSSLKLGIKAATLGALDAADMKEVASDWASEVSALEDKYVGELITKSRAKLEAIQAFQSALAELPRLLSAGVSGGAEAKPLVVIIDELDRCRPVFALELLERIKHFFAVPHVHFVLGVHLGQLRNSVKVAYGADIDAHLYLQKFIHFTINLIDEGGSFDKWSSTRYLNYLEKQLEFEAEFRDYVGDAKAFIVHVSKAQNFSLRSLERIMTAIAVSLAFNGKTRLPPEILGGLCILKVVHPELFAKAKIEALGFAEIADRFALNVPFNRSLAKLMTHARYMWMYFTGHTLGVDTDQRETYQQFKRWFGDSSPSLLAEGANQVVDKLQQQDMA